MREKRAKAGKSVAALRDSMARRAGILRPLVPSFGIPCACKQRAAFKRGRAVRRKFSWCRAANSIIRVRIGPTDPARRR